MNNNRLGIDLFCERGRIGEGGLGGGVWQAVPPQKKKKKEKKFLHSKNC